MPILLVVGMLRSCESFKSLSCCAEVAILPQSPLGWHCTAADEKRLAERLESLRASYFIGREPLMIPVFTVGALTSTNGLFRDPNTYSRSSGWIISRTVAMSMGPFVGVSPKMR
jgi:hypothetical protein